MEYDSNPQQEPDMTHRSNNPGGRSSSSKSTQASSSPSQASSRSGSQSDRQDLSGSKGQSCPPGQRSEMSDDEEE
jgi:hypothetical protein